MRLPPISSSPWSALSSYGPFASPTSTTSFHMKTNEDKDTKIAILKIILQKKTFQYENEKAKKRKNKNKNEPCHPELDWAS